MSKGVILCVDEEKMVLQSAESQLVKEFGPECQIEPAEGSEEALELMD